MLIENAHTPAPKGSLPANNTAPTQNVSPFLFLRVRPCEFVECDKSNHVVYCINAWNMRTAIDEWEANTRCEIEHAEFTIMVHAGQIMAWLTYSSKTLFPPVSAVSGPSTILTYFERNHGSCALSFLLKVPMTTRNATSKLKQQNIHLQLKKRGSEL